MMAETDDGRRKESGVEGKEGSRKEMEVEEVSGWRRRKGERYRVERRRRRR